jgi:hypothetical protein
MSCSRSPPAIDEMKWAAVVPVLAEIVSQCPLTIDPKNRRLASMLEAIRSRPLRGTSVVEELTVIKVPSNTLDPKAAANEITYCISLKTTDTARFVSLAHCCESRDTGWNIYENWAEKQHFQPILSTIYILVDCVAERRRFELSGPLWSRTPGQRISTPKHLISLNERIIDADWKSLRELDRRATSGICGVCNRIPLAQ